MSLFQGCLVFLVIVAAPCISSAYRVCDVVQHCGCDNAGSNDTHVQTECLQHCLDGCHDKSATDGMATIVFPTGVYHTGSLVIPSNTTLRLENGSTLLGSINPEDYPLVPPLPGYGTARDCCCNDWLKYNCSVPADVRHQALLSSSHAENIVIEGHGVIDGQGWTWWIRFETLGLDAGRPHLVEPMFTQNIRIEGVWLKDSAFWTLHPYACDDVTVRRVRITADVHRGHNTDGIDPDSSRNVLVEECYVKVGDDAVAIKSGIDFWGRKFGRPSENIVIRNNVFVSKHVSLGSEESGGIRNISILNNILGEPGQAYESGIHFKTERGRGGYIQDIIIRNLSVVGRSQLPIWTTLYYSDGRNKTNASATPSMSNILIEDVFVHAAEPGEVAEFGKHDKGVAYAGAFTGLPESPIENITLRNVTVQLAQGAPKATGWLCANVKTVSSFNVKPPLDRSCFMSAGDTQVKIEAVVV